MISYEDLYAQNHKITELSNVLSVLLKDRLLCDSATCTSLFYNYMDLVEGHIKNVDSNLYVDLLRDQSSDANNIATNFMSGSQEIKRIMNSYARKWCDKRHHELTIGAQHEKFIEATDEMFEMVLNRIQDEMEHLYPMVRKINAS